MIGWISVHRCLLEKPIWLASTPEQKAILITVLLLADHQPNEWEWKGEKFKTKPGEFVTSLNSIMEKTGKGISIQNVRSALKRFEKLQFLTNESTKQGRHIKIINWDAYQEKQAKGNKRGNKGVTKGQQRPNKDLTPNNNGIMKQWNNEIKKDVPEWLNINSFEGFLLDRIERKHELTKRSIKLLVTALEKACGGNYDLQEQVINKSIENGWKSFFKLKENGKPKQDDNSGLGAAW